MKRKLTSILGLSAAALLTVGALASCGDEGTDVAKIIEQAEKMDENELYAKAMEEIRGKEFVVVANSSRMKDAAPAWKEYVKTKYSDKDFDFTFKSTQPKNNQIFAQIKADVTGKTHNISMTLIQDGSQIKSKMTKPGYLLNYIPKEWAGDKAKDGEPLALQSLSKVFVYNVLADDKGNTHAYNNVWDYATEVSTQFMAPSSEPVGQNFLYMLTRADYAAVMKEAYNVLPAERKTAIDKIIAADGVDSGIPQLMEEASFVDDAKYSLAWIYSFLKKYTRVSDDGPISEHLTDKDSGGTAGLLVYSKFRSIKESAQVSNSFVKCAAYDDNYVGIGGYMYKHYLQILKTSPFPWTSCALTQFMVCHKEGFQPWGKDMGGYSSNSQVQAQFDHSHDGAEVKEVRDPDTGDVITPYSPEMPIKNDKGYDWWTANEAGKGRLVMEDGEYASSVAAVMSDWIAYL